MSNEIQQHLDKVDTSLTDFQRSTVKAIVARFNNEGKSRVLVADEVGLGKTIVAKGVIAKLLDERIQNGSDILKVTYICSNQTLAHENRKKLAIFSSSYAGKYVRNPSFYRLAELGVDQILDEDDDKILEVCSLTPGTSFDLTRGHGNKLERYIIYQALTQHPLLASYDDDLYEFFRSDVTTWHYDEGWYESQHGLNAYIREEFHSLLGENVTLSDEDLQSLGAERDTWLKLIPSCVNELVCTDDQNLKRIGGRIRSCLRQMFVGCCARNLSADLFILDEFQRFKELLDTKGSSEQGLIAEKVFTKQGESKVLLLSATPFKAITSVSEEEGQNAHVNQLQYLLEFLANGSVACVKRYHEKREELLTQILRLRDPVVEIESVDDRAKIGVEAALRPMICRTERSQVSSAFETVLKTEHRSCTDSFTVSDIKSFIAIDGLGQKLKELQGARYSSQLMEFYKIAPWPLSFLSGYAFKRQLERFINDKNVKAALKRSKNAWLDKGQINDYRVSIERDAPNAKMQMLSRAVFAEKGELLLWIPPSLPYYPFEGVFKGQDSFSKTLIFSAFVMAPRALSSLLSYEAERRLLATRRGGRKPKYFDKKKVTPLFRFEGRGSLATWSLIYPSFTLQEFQFLPGSESLKEVIKYIKAELKESVKLLKQYEGKRKKAVKTSDNWYALAPILLDHVNGYQSWSDNWINWYLTEIESGNIRNGKLENIRRLKGLMLRHEGLGPMPKDLVEYLAMLAIAGPAVCIARTWRSVWGVADEDIMSCATDAATAFLMMFNKQEAQRVLKRSYPKQSKSWRSLLQYCADGNLQAVLDEYCHQLKTCNYEPFEALDKFEEVTGLQTSTITVQAFHDRKMNKDIRLRCHYAVPMGNQQKAIDNSGLERITHVRDSFNSPFRPFVLSSTSIGQEGLDFHWYCSRVVHWSLPSNPIDIEQREGRVNRYKSLIVRRRVADAFGDEVCGDHGDIWQELFNTADNQTKSKRKTDLVPYWHMPGDRHHLERVVPMFPLSREVEKLDNLLKILSLYRLAFGQPRQQELLENLLHRELSDEEIELIRQKLVIDLAPVNYMP